MSIATINKDHSSFFMFIYNGFENNNIEGCIDDIVGIQEKLFDFGLTISGFQFIGLVFEKQDNMLTHIKVAYFLLALGFVLSLFGSLLSYITSRFFRSIKCESKEFIILSVKKYNGIFMMSYVIPLINSTLFLLPFNILIYDILDFYFCIIFNVFSFIILITGLALHQIVVFRKQIFKMKSRNEDIELGELNNNTENQITLCKRRLSKYIEER